MVAIPKGRFTAASQDSVVVFLVGVRINKFLQIWRGLPFLIAMIRALWYLSKNEDAGMLKTEMCLCWRGAFALQYWRSFEDLERFARYDQAPHLVAWRNANKRLAKSTAIGIFHETYVTTPDTREVIYVNMDAWGMSEATKSHTSLSNAQNTARGRMDAPPTTRDPSAPHNG
jgi:hypothetical protein